MLAGYIEILRNIPLELQQNIFRRSLKLIDDEDCDGTEYGAKTFSGKVWNKLNDLLKFVGFNNNITIDIDWRVITVKISLYDNININILRKSIVESPSWVESVSYLNLTSLKLNVKVLDPERDCIVVKLVSIIINKFNPQKFILTNISHLLHELLVYRYQWIDKITELDLHGSKSTCESLFGVIDQFKNLKSVSFSGHLSTLTCMSISCLELLLNKLDEMLLEFIGNFEIIDTDESDYIVDRFLTFTESNPKILVNLMQFAGPLTRNTFRLLSNAKKIDRFCLHDFQIFEFVNRLSDTPLTNNQILEIFKVESLKSVKFDVPVFNNFKLESSALINLTIQSTNLGFVNFSGLIKLLSLTIETSDTIDIATFNSIPTNVTELNINTGFSPMNDLYCVPKYIQKLKTIPELLGHFDFSNNSHISELYLKTDRLDEIYEDFHSWQNIPETVDYLSLEYTHEYTNILGLNDRTKSNKMFGICIPDTISDIKLDIRFMDTYSKTDIIYINSDRINKSSIFNRVTGLYNGDELWANIVIGQSTELCLILRNINEDILIICDDSVISNVHCVLGDFHMQLKKVKGKAGVSYLSLPIEKESLLSCTVV